MDNEELYRGEIAGLSMAIISDEIVELARGGNAEAKYQIITGLLQVVCAYSMRRSTARAGGSQRDAFNDVTELIARGNYLLVLKLDEALRHPKPIGYLLKTIWHEMRYDDRSSSVSLSLLEEYDWPEPSVVAPSPDYTPLYRAIEEVVPEQVQTLLARLYGLYGYGVETLGEIAGGNAYSDAYKATKMRKQYYCRKLRRYLETYYPNFVRQHAFI